MKKTYANLILVCVTIIWGGGFIATAGALEHFTPFYVMMIRFIGASILPLLLSFKVLRSMDIVYIKEGIVTGILLFLAFAFQTFGLQYTTPGKNAFLTATNVVLIPYLLWLILHRKPRRKEVIASIICVAGIALMTLKKEAFYLNSGDMLSLCCALFFALHMIALERYSSHMDTIAMTALQMLTAGILSVVCAICFETAPGQINAAAIGSVVYLIVVSTLIAYLLQTFAQKYTTANSASLILSMEALFASIFAFLLLHETMTWQMIIGGCLIFTSVIYIEYQPNKRLKKQQKA